MNLSLAQFKEKSHLFFDQVMDDQYFSQCDKAYQQTRLLLKKMRDQFHSVDIYHLDPYIQQMDILLNPKFYPLTNPDVVRKTFETQGDNLITGFINFKNDTMKGMLPSLTKVDFFKLGENVATTKGDIIYQNELFQLIHYKPLKKKVFSEPLLIIPPWINKYYIFDLGKEKSFIQYSLKKGIDVYVISWKNPDEKDRHLTLSCYVKKGIENAISFIDKNIHILGFCLGGVGTILSASRDKDKRIRSMTLLATPIDFHKLKELQQFIGLLDIKSYKKKILTQGYQCGKDLLRMFCLMRSETMILNNIVDQYYLNKEPKPNDFLYWNMDSTNLPAVMHLEYIEKFFKKNLMIKGQYKIDNKKINLEKLSMPIFVVATEKDHIVPMESAFDLYRYNLDIRFVLAGSGHIAGIINPPESKKYGYKVYDHNGKFEYEKKYSWWPEWFQWIKNKMSEETEEISSYESIEPAPGSYALYQPALEPYHEKL